MDWERGNIQKKGWGVSISNSFHNVRLTGREVTEETYVKGKVRRRGA